MSRKNDFNTILQEDASNFTTKIDSADAATTYIGKALLGTVTSDNKWQIKKISVDENVTTISFANGDDDFNQIWDNRASLTYS